MRVLLISIALLFLANPVQAQDQSASAIEYPGLTESQQSIVITLESGILPPEGINFASATVLQLPMFFGIPSTQGPADYPGNAPDPSNYREAVP